ncbi:MULTISPECIES: DUF397 domain-containing protein [unclassified Streptomyces]|uniref:DUF397 domain-containing protein n=1 Tax=unclassified Streptomyces TaxID=2593676 RepID=UPI0033F974BF
MRTQWQKSSYSGVEAEDCVELAPHEPHAALRESDDPDAVIATTRPALSALIRWQKLQRPHEGSRAVPGDDVCAGSVSRSGNSTPLLHSAGVRPGHDPRHGE